MVQPSRRILTAVGLSLMAPLFVAACSDSVDDVIADGTEAEYVLCEGPAGSWTDLTDEPEGWREGSGPRVDWTDDAGCAINLDSLFHTFGDDHCDWERVEFISIGLPIGSPFTGPEADPPGQDWSPFFLFNTDGAVGGVADGEQLTPEDVPADATDIGAKTATGRRLRLATDEQTLYEVQGEVVRAFVQIDADEVGCA